MVDDLNQLYKDSLVLFKNRPVYVEGFFDNNIVSYFDLTDQRSRVKQYEEGMFLPPTRRIGFVNIGQSVIYVYRNPVRKYKVGYSLENLKFSLPDVRFPFNRTAAKDRVMSLRCPEIVDSMFGRYPSFPEAMSYLETFSGACAIDKQFALGASGVVFYRTREVGRFKRTAESVKDITFSEGNEHLIMLLENTYEKATPIVRV